MEQKLITSVRFLGALPMFIAAVCLVMFNQGKLQSAVYNRSRWFFTAATLLLGIQFTIQYFYHLREQSVTLCWTLNMMAYVIATPVYNMAELNLLRAGHNMKLKVKVIWLHGWRIAFTMQSDNFCYCMLAVKCSFECKRTIVCVLTYICLLTAVQQNFLTSIKNIVRAYRLDLLTSPIVVIIRCQQKSWL